MKVISIANQKGGVAKTTTAVSIAQVLRERGYKVLFIDSDVQCNSTDTYNAEFEGMPTLYDVILDDNQMDIKDAMQETPYGPIIASDPLMREGDSKLSTKGLVGYKALRKALDKFEKDTNYDFVIIDSAPKIDMVLRNVLIASDYVLIPVTADRYGLQGLSDLVTSINDSKELNEDLKIAGILFVRFNERTNLANDIRNSLNDTAKKLDTKIFDTFIRECNKVKESQTLRVPLQTYDRNCSTARDYRFLVDELLERIENDK